MNQRNAVQDAMELFARRVLLEKRAGAWYRRHDSVLAIVDLQKSQYGRQYYLNVGFWLQQLEIATYPKPAKSHITVRLEALAPSERQRIAALLDLDQTITDATRSEELLDVLKRVVQPVIARGDSLEGLRAMVEDGTLRTAAIRGPAQELLGAGRQLNR